MPPDAAVHVALGGLLGDAVRASRRGRLFHFITGAESPAVRLFDRAVAAHNFEGDWYGEHAGKWLVAAARAAARTLVDTGDATLRDRVHAVADHLVAQQEADGYLGTYAAPRRFPVPQPPKPVSWDGAPSLRTWDIWTHSYLVLGLLEAHGQLAPGHSRWLDAACRIGDLCCSALATIDITDLGNHHGMSATVLMDPAVTLYRATGEQRYLDLALLVLEQANRHPPLALLPRALAGVDAADIATGKAYQLAWNLVGLAKLHGATGRRDLREAVDKLWHSIAEHHLSLGGGPWGGAGLRSRECFNPPGVFDPRGYVETCSTLAWIQLNRALLALAAEADDGGDDRDGTADHDGGETAAGADNGGNIDGADHGEEFNGADHGENINGAAHGAVACRHADAIEQSAYNDLLGALAPDGEDWCYYVFANGRRTHTTTWRCCKSSGAMALEELPGIACTQPRPGVVDINLYGPCSTRLVLPDGTALDIEQATAYPFDGDITLRVQPSRPVRFVLRLRCPTWAGGATLQVAGVLQAPPRAGTYTRIDRTWAPGDWVALQLPMAPRLHLRVNQNTQESRAPDGAAVRQQVLREAYVAITRGPLVYATTLIDGYKTAETVRLPPGPRDDWLTLLPATAAMCVPASERGDVAPAGAGAGVAADADASGAGAAGPGAGTHAGPAIQLSLRDRPPLVFTPYYRTGGRSDGAWRLTWLQLAPTEEIP